MTMQMAERLLSLPRVLGVHPASCELPITLHQGRFGPYVTMELPSDAAAERDTTDAAGSSKADEMPKMVMCSLPKRVSLWEIDAAAAAELLNMKMERDKVRRAKGGLAGKRGGSKVSPPTKPPAKRPVGAKKVKARKPAAKKPAGAGDPKRPLNAYMLYTREHRESFKQKQPRASIGELSKLMGQSWKAMSDSDKLPYATKADQLRAEYLVAKTKADNKGGTT